MSAHTRSSTGPARSATCSRASSSRRSCSAAAQSLAARRRPPRSSAAAPSPSLRCTDTCGRQERGSAAGSAAGRAQGSGGPAPRSPSRPPAPQPPRCHGNERGSRAEGNWSSFRGKPAAMIGRRGQPSLTRDWDGRGEAVGAGPSLSQPHSGGRSASGTKLNKKNRFQEHFLNDYLKLTQLSTGTKPRWQHLIKNLPPSYLCQSGRQQAERSP